MYLAEENEFWFLLGYLKRHSFDDTQGKGQVLSAIGIAWCIEKKEQKKERKKGKKQERG